MIRTKLWVLFLVVLNCHKFSCEHQAIHKSDFSIHEGHNQPFGESGSKQPVDWMNGFPETQLFWEKYVRASKPLLMKNAAKLSLAYYKWSDSYLRTAAKNNQNNQVTELLCETEKKENRKQSVEYKTMDEFLDVYNTTDLYLVDDVPSYLLSDLLLPCPIQCENLQTAVDKVMLWFSSGGTKSVVHVDDYDNINCVFRGNKTVVFLDRPQQSNMNPDHGDGSYDIDVDEVDLNKNSHLFGKVFNVALLEAGDCVYIPYLWIHQVRSEGSNLAVNFWWQHQQGLNYIDRNICSTSTPCDHTLSLDKSIIESIIVSESDVEKDRNLPMHQFGYLINPDLVEEAYPHKNTKENRYDKSDL